MTDDVLADASNAKTERPLTSALRNAIADVKGIAGLLLAIVGMIGAYVGLRDAIRLEAPWPIVGCLVPVPIFFLFYVLPEWRQARASRRLHQLGVRGRVKEPGYFRLTAYEANDAQRFVRPDNAHIAVVRWIRETTSPILYLSGQSGVGKSSLLGAAVLPTLLAGEEKWIVHAIRLHDDPIGAIRRSFRQYIDEQVDSNLSMTDLISRVMIAAKAQDARLLLCIDQFEEFLILLQEADQRLPFVALLRELTATPRQGLTILLSLRAEYLSDIEGLDLPPPSFGRNCLEVRAFSHADAQDFIERSEINAGPALMEEIFAEVSEIEDMPDRVRPVVLNMMGLVLASFRGALPKGIQPGRLLSGYIYRAISAADVRAYAAGILKPLVTSAGTKRALPLDTIAQDAGLSLSVARGCLLRLAESGLVRATDEKNNLWEIAHDFVARLIHPMTQSASRSAWDRGKNWIAPGALVCWLLLVAASVYVYPSWYDDRVRKQLDNAGIVAAAAEKSGGLAFQYNGQAVDEETLRKASAALGQIRAPVHRLNLKDAHQLKSIKDFFLPDTLVSLELGSGLKDLEGLPALPNLVSLKVNSSSISGMPTFPKLEQLSVSGGRGLANLPVLPSLTNLTFSSLDNDVSLIGMPILPSLTSLDLNFVPKLSNFKGLPVLPSIKSISVQIASISTLIGMPSLPTLTSLTLSNVVLKDLEGFPHLPALNKLVLVDGGVGSNAWLVSLKGMPTLPALKHMDIGGASELTDLNGLPSLPALKSLSLRGLSKLQSLKGLPAFPNLERLQLDSMASLSNLSGMASFPALKRLSIGSFGLPTNGLQTLADMPSLPALEEFNLSQLFKLKSLEGMPSFPALSKLLLQDTSLDSVASIPALPSLVELRIHHTGDQRNWTFLGPPASESSAEQASKIKTLAGLPRLPNLRIMSLNGDLLDTIPNGVRLEKVTLTDVQYLLPLERFSDTLRELTIWSSKIQDWNSIASLRNLESVEIGEDEFRAIGVLRQLRNVKSLRFSGNGDLDLTPLSELEVEVVLEEQRKPAVKLPTKARFRTVWRSPLISPISDD